MVTQKQLKSLVSLRAEVQYWSHHAAVVEARIAKSYRDRKIEKGPLTAVITKVSSLAVSYGKVVARLKTRFPKMYATISRLVRRYSREKVYTVITVSVKG